ncbi:MAG: 2-hydroxyacyl-CoA dehydratase family protein [Desulfobacteraceae bacterium]|nr:2-hydroxyacyl-CoA dehydratase family protein [Desulfobacteraceae bacterium]
MSSILSQAARSIDLDPVRKFKEKGGTVIGYTCSFVPVEIFHAAGMLPIRLRGINTESLNIGDAYYGPFVCTFPKALLQQAGQGSFKFLDGAVISAGCDAMRRLDECWRKMSEDVPGALPPSWFYYLDVPHKPQGVALEWYQSRIRKLIQALEEKFGVHITDESLHLAISKQNKVRTALGELAELRCLEPAVVSGTEAFEALIARNVLPTDIYLEELDRLIEEVKSRAEPVSGYRKRLFITGSICDDLELVEQIEAAGAVVVGETVCYGLRNTSPLVSDTGDPVAALSAFYLSGSVCPRMFGYYPTRLVAISGRIKRTQAQGVIMQNIRFCDLHGSENGLLERDLEKLDVPTLRIEKEYGALTEKGRLRMRIDAFLEQLEKSRPPVQEAEG